MADEKLPKSDGGVPGAAGPKPHPGYKQDMIYAGAPSPGPRPDAVAAGIPPSPQPPVPPARSEAVTANPPAPPPPGQPPKTDVAAHRSEIDLFLSWSAGVVIIFVGGWGWIIGLCYLARIYHLHVPLGVVGALGSLVSLGLFFVLERNLWLSRFMGLRLGPHSTQLTETLFFFFTGIVGLLIRSSDRPAPAVAKPHENDGTREIVETVVFVVVLVLLLKTFLVEAFVIPTGSMADTLLGYHREFTCDKCKYRFVVNCSTQAEPQPGREPDVIKGGVCPNCGEPCIPQVFQQR